MHEHQNNGYLLSINEWGFYDTPGRTTLERKLVLFNDTFKHLLYGYMASDMRSRPIQITEEETRCHHFKIDSIQLLASVFYMHRPRDRTIHTTDWWSSGRKEK